MFLPSNNLFQYYDTLKNVGYVIKIRTYQEQVIKISSCGNQVLLRFSMIIHYVTLIIQQW